MNRPWVAIQRNPHSGTRSRGHHVLALIETLRTAGIRPRLFSRRDRLTQQLQLGDAQPPVCIVAAGGDGTVRDVFNRFPGLPIAILPLGSENLFAKSLGIPRSGHAVAEMIAAGNTRRIDLCALDFSAASSRENQAVSSEGGEPQRQGGRREALVERRFGVMASFGFDADVVRRTHARRSGHITKASYVQPILQSLRKYQYPRLRLFPDCSETPLTGRMAILMNLPAYALGLPVAESARCDDGLLDLRLFQRGSAFQMLRYVYKVAMKSHETLEDVQSVRASRFRVEADEPVPIQVDGDPAGWTPVEIRVLPSELEVFVPDGQTEKS